MNTAVYWLVLVGVLAAGYMGENFPLPEPELAKVLEE